MGSMADLRPFKAMRYDTSIAGDAAGLVAPPYDVVSDADRAELYGRSGYNISHVDFGPDQTGDGPNENRYTRSRRDIEAWLYQGALKIDAEPRLYVYDQEFELD